MMSHAKPGALLSLILSKKQTIHVSAMYLAHYQCLINLVVLVLKVF
jgi:hypothetical protein